MASIHRRPRSKYFQAAFRDGQGRLIQRSTKVTDRSKAMTIALEWERLAKNLDELVESQARKVVSDLMERVGNEAIRAPSTKKFLSDWILGKELNRSESTAIRYRGIVESFLKGLGQKAERPITAISPTDIQSYLKSRMEGGCSPSTIALEGKALSGAFGQAVRRGLTPANPVDTTELPARTPVKRGVFTPAEIGILVSEASGEWPSLILLAYYTGARLSDCVKMKWMGVDLAARTLTYKVKKKGGQEHVIPLHPHLEAHLVSLAALDGSVDYIMPSMASMGPGGRHGLSEGFKRIVRKAGLDLQTVQGNGKRKIARRTFHSLRHSFTSQLANAGVPEELRMKLTGHSTRAVHQGYTHHELTRLSEALSKIPDVSPSLPVTTH